MFVGVAPELAIFLGRRHDMEPLEQTADPDTVLQEVVARIVAAGDPQRIVLFGSRARYDNSEDSDIDLLVIEDSELPRYKRSPRY